MPLGFINDSVDYPSDFRHTVLVIASERTFKAADGKLFAIHLGILAYLADAVSDAGFQIGLDELYILSCCTSLLCNAVDRRLVSGCHSAGPPVIVYEDDAPAAYLPQFVELPPSGQELRRVNQNLGSRTLRSQLLGDHKPCP